ncbi:MAG: RluA family pseudouridine synthase [Lachnospiraceae bacterium]|nr:RluA family pseudouridine synthase [Lachnospiraceae bacterium]
MKEYILRADEDNENERIDRYVTYVLADLSRSYIQKLIEGNNITVNGRNIRSSYRVSISDEIKVTVPEDLVPDIKPEDIPLDILYEDDDVLVVNKPKGMVVHPAPGHYEHTLVNALMYRCRDNLSGINGVLRPGIVHRIDKDTTGSIIVCKNDAAHKSLAEQLKGHSLRREYVAIVTGELKDEAGTIDKPIGRSRSDRKKMAIVPDGKRAVTCYTVEKRLKGFTLVRCRLETGRTHQIRVHMASIGHPVAGDPVYGNKTATPVDTCGQALHARILGFLQPVTGKYIETNAPIPEYMEAFISLSEKV